MGKNKKIAIVGAGEAAAPIIRKAREMGVVSVAFGGDDSLCKQEADIFHNVDIFDIEKLFRIAKEENVDGVIASSEITSESAALLANKLSLPGNNVSKGFAGRNKYDMRCRMQNATYTKQPEYFLYDGQEINKYPVVIKAVDSCGKRGISFVKTQVELNDAIKYAKEYSSNDMVLVEDYIEGGQEFSVECLANDGKVQVIQITEKETAGPPHFVEIGHHQPAMIGYTCRCNIEKSAQEILSTLGITCGMAHLEIKVKNNDIYFIEVGARAGGDHIADILTVISTDFDYYKAAIECSIGEYKEVEPHNICFSGLYFCCEQNAHLSELFKIAPNKKWCEIDMLKNDYFEKVSSNIEAVNAGYFIYKADHKITLQDVKNTEYVAKRINDDPNAFSLLWEHNKEIGRTLTDEELTDGINKFIKNGNAIVILDDNHVIGFLNLYCNNFETRKAYICNVYILDEYRGKGLSKKLVDEAISISYLNNFDSIVLHVAEDNVKAINLYKGYGFEFTGKYKMTDEKELEMELYL